MQGDKWFDFTDLRGGRNDNDPDLAIPGDQVKEALNVDYYKGMCGRRRGGSASVGITFSSGGPFASGIKSLITHYPSADITAAELWAADGSNQLCRLAGSTQWTEPSPKDAITASPTEVKGVSFNGKLQLGHKSGVNRGQVWDGTSLRRLGLAPPTAVPTTSASAGAVTDTRKYRSRVLVKSGSDYLRRSEGCSGASSAQVLAAQRSTVTLAGAPSEGETHWECYGASIINNYATYHYIGEAAIGNTIEDNNASLTGDLEPVTGTFLVPPSFKFAAAGDDRVLYGGNNETTSSYGQVAPKNNRVWWTPPLGDRDVSDDERIIITAASATAPAIKSYLDVSAPLTGIGGPIFGSYYVFSYYRFWRFSPTGSIYGPFRRIAMGLPFGCIFDKSICLGEDQDGGPALYWASHKGIYRISDAGVEFCGWDNQTLWGTVNLAATVPVHCVYHADIHQLWVYIATGSALTPNKKLVFDTRLGTPDGKKGITKGWSLHDGDSADAVCSTLFANTIGATMSRDLKPYIGRGTGTAIYKADTTDTTDNGTTWQSYIEKTVLPPPTIQNKFRIGPMYVLAKAVAATLRVTITADYGDQTAKVVDRSITPAGSETEVFRQFEDSALGGIWRAATLRLGDAAAGDVPQWFIDEWKCGLDPEQAL